MTDAPSRAEANRRTYDDARLAAVYDVDNAAVEDHVFFRRVADEVAAVTDGPVARIVDLGCGTGILTVTLAGEGRSVVGIDPAEAMLEVARTRPDGDDVTWRRGTAELIEPDSADLAVMSGNVAMHLIGDDWHAALRRIGAGLVPGGRLVFETRNPARRAWEGWQQDPTERTTPAGRLIESERTSAPDEDGVVTMHVRTEFPDSGDVLELDQHLQFRSAEQVRADLAVAGLRVERISGDWRRTPFDPAEDRMLVVEAVRG
ncbi:class I SAM-dependent methyltransferase [Micrococcus flavus]|uniref:SAM-dependent methyltransferase n=1 Tax=Micrococcus flavus TaxID=384602 RepID=A0A4Y8WZ87_9MICC|nr:class I SAM-dependent methyltransferase [Micrococcus flavus]MBB4881768.1 SAM-dependent methyltransferase [Micrococcus flavus]TFI01043.1 class I SAM-dependent methyltransferase [Micrococcus flavus]GGK53287.1 methyltransferase type 11 [Micrococcus flavus]